MKISLLLFTLISMLTSLSSLAADSCLDLFPLESEKTSTDTSALRSESGTGLDLTESDFPKELKVYSGLIEFASKTGQLGVLRNVSVSLKQMMTIFPVFPVIIKRVAERQEEDLPLIPNIPTTWAQNANTLNYRRSYKAISEMIERLQNIAVPKNKIPEITEENRQFLAAVTESLVPREPPVTLSIDSNHTLADRMEKRVAMVLRDGAYREIWASLIDAGIDLALTSIRGLYIVPQGFRYDPVKITEVANKIKSKRSLNSDDIKVITLIAYRFFLSQLVSEDPRSVERVMKPFSVNRVVEIIGPIENTLRHYKLSPSVRLAAVEMFDTIYFGVPLPLTYEETYSSVMRNVIATLQPLKKAYNDHLKSEQAAAVASATPSPNIFAQPVPLNLLSKSQVPLSPRLHAKTRGRAKPVVTELVEQESSTEKPLAVKDLIEQPHIFNLTPDTEYRVVFERQKREYNGENVFVFSQRAAKEMNALQSREYNDILEAIKFGPTTHDSGQAGIKILGAPTKLEGRLYEVKIRPSFRAAVQRVGNKWRVLAVVPKDQFDAYLETLK